MEWLEQLKDLIKGEVKTDAISCHVYSVDASIFEVVPKAIVIPFDTQDIIHTILIAKKHFIPITPRGAATGITGGCLGAGIVIDISRHFNKILNIDYEKEYVICEPGVIQDDLNNTLKEKGYRLGPDTSTGNRATLGGMLANNAAGARSLYFGKMVDHILEVELVLSNGSLITLKEESEEHLNEIKLKENHLSDIYKATFDIKEKYKKEIEAHFPSLPRRVSGYNLDELIKNKPLNLSKLIAGSEGTLGIVTKMKLKICKSPKFTGFCILLFHDMTEGMRQLEDILTFHPFAVELIDQIIVDTGRRSPKMKGKLVWLENAFEAIFIVEFESDNFSHMQEKVFNFERHCLEKGIGFSRKTIFDEQEMADIWELRKAGLGLLLSKRTYSRAIAFIEDISVPPKHLANFMEKFCLVLKKYQKEAGIYGHAGSGCLHIRPYIDLRNSHERLVMKEIMLEVTDLLIEFQGSLSGEHGDGYIRSWLNEKLFGKEIYKAFQELKMAFDPLNLMNPGKIVNGAFETSDKHFRTNEKDPQNKLKTFLDFSKEGGFELAADLCNGNGECRKQEKLMCPSFQASKDEYDTTRARAQTLRSIINGHLPKEEFFGEGLKDILDLCLECKGCKKECPSQVDMAKMKSEILYQHQKKHGISLRNWLFANIGKLNKFLSFIKLRFLPPKFILKWLRITIKRKLPKLSKQTFSSWIKKQPDQNERLPSVVLFNDTFTEYNYPEIGIAAYQVLQHIGYQVIVPKVSCCGRTYISKGLLKQARTLSEKMLYQLNTYVNKNIPIIVLEPSCLSAIVDDAHFLIDKSNIDLKKMAENIAKKSFSFEQFLANHSNSILKNIREKEIVYHRHCHQKSLDTTDFIQLFLNKQQIKNFQEIPSGCCGVAGSFGYEKEHEELSLNIGELHLLPYIRNLDKETLVIANGVSCRSQIEYGTDIKALHIAELAALALNLEHS